MSYHDNEPEWPKWVAFLASILCIGGGLMGFPFFQLIMLEWVSLKTALLISGTIGVLFGVWIIKD